MKKLDTNGLLYFLTDCINDFELSGEVIYLQKARSILSKFIEDVNKGGGINENDN